MKLENSGKRRCLLEIYLTMYLKLRKQIVDIEIKFARSTQKVSESMDQLVYHELFLTALAAIICMSCHVGQ